MINYKKLIGSTAVYGFLGFLPLMSRFILFPIFVNILTQTDYAIIGLTNTVFSFLTILLAFGLDSAFTRYYFDFKFKENVLKTFITTIFIAFIAIQSLLFLVAFWQGDTLFELIFKDERYEFNPFGYIAIGLAIFSAFNSIILVYFRNGEKLSRFAVFSVLLFLLPTLAESYTILVLDGDAEFVLKSRLISTGVLSVVGWIYFLWDKPLRFDFRFLRIAFPYSFPMIIYSLLIFFYTGFDRVLIENYLTLEELAIFNMAFTIASVMEIILIAMDSALVPQLYDQLKNDPQNAIVNANRVFKVLGLVTIVSVLFIALTAPYFVTNFTPESYHSALKIIPILLVGFIFRFYYGVYNKPLFFYKKLKKAPLLNLIAAIAMILSNVLLLPKYGLLGAAVAMVITRITLTIATILLVKNEVQFEFRLTKVHLGMALLIALLLSLAFNS
ncbi:lipopolysaccharide biosynthesis protein [Ekhidna sp.]